MLDKDHHDLANGQQATMSEARAFDQNTEKPLKLEGRSDEQ
jgi:hypothetical protein